VVLPQVGVLLCVLRVLRLLCVLALLTVLPRRHPVESPQHRIRSLRPLQPRRCHRERSQV
jgi:hypothetical protein